MPLMEITVTTRINTGTVAAPAQAFLSTTSTTITVSQYVAQQLILATGASAFRVSYPQFSNLNTLVLMATSTLRVNVLNWDATASSTSSLSAGSAGGQFKDFFMIAGSSISGPVAIELANSTADSVACTMIFGM